MSEEIKKPIEQWQKEKQAPQWAYMAAKAYFHWVVGHEVTETEFDEAIKRITHIPIA